MKKHFDIREYKTNLRQKYKDLRQQMPAREKEQKDRQIAELVLGLRRVKQAKTLLCFVSTPMEVDTHFIIRQALRDGKTVAVPYCVENTRKMRFYAIQSLEELVPRTFGVLEPVPEKSRRVLDFYGSVCILPGLSFDQSGFRLGYGGGYYDRFLSHVYKGGTTVGVCYARCTRRQLTHGRFDVPCQYLVTEKGVQNLQSLRKKEQAPPERGFSSGSSYSVM